jgi:hypothetical protein
MPESHHQLPIGKIELNNGGIWGLIGMTKARIIPRLRLFRVDFPGVKGGLLLCDQSLYQVRFGATGHINAIPIVENHLTSLASQVFDHVVQIDNM